MACVGIGQSNDYMATSYAIGVIFGNAAESTLCDTVLVTEHIG